MEAEGEKESSKESWATRQTQAVSGVQISEIWGDRNELAAQSGCLLRLPWQSGRSSERKRLAGGVSRKDRIPPSLIRREGGRENERVPTKALVKEGASVTSGRLDFGRSGVMLVSWIPYRRLEAIWGTPAHPLPSRWSVWEKGGNVDHSGQRKRGQDLQQIGLSRLGGYYCYCNYMVVPSWGGFGGGTARQCTDAQCTRRNLLLLARRGTESPCRGNVPVFDLLGVFLAFSPAHTFCGRERRLGNRQ